MECGNCGANTPNYYGYKGGSLCPDCYDRLRSANAKEKRQIEERLQHKADEKAGERAASDFQQAAALIWGGIGMVLMASVLLLSSWKEEKHGVIWVVAWLALVTGGGLLMYSVRAKMLLRQLGK